MRTSWRQHSCCCVLGHTSLQTAPTRLLPEDGMWRCHLHPPCWCFITCTDGSTLVLLIDFERKGFFSPAYQFSLMHANFLSLTSRRRGRREVPQSYPSVSSLLDRYSCLIQLSASIGWIQPMVKGLLNIFECSALTNTLQHGSQFW